MKKFFARIGCLITCLGGVAVIYFLINKDLTRNTGEYTFLAMFGLILGLLIWRKARAEIKAEKSRRKRRSWILDEKDEE